MNNKHVGGDVTVKLLSRQFRFGAPRIGTAGFPRLEFQRSAPAVLSGKLSYADGGLLRFDAPLMPGEQDELDRIVESVAKRVELYLADRLERDKANRKRSTRTKRT